ncbi:MAG: C13 family peptidase [Hyphomonadaceae bacterium]
MRARIVAAFLTAALLTMAAPVDAQQQAAPDPLLGQFGAIVEVAPPPPEAARLANLMSASLAALEPQRRRHADVYLLVASLWDDPVFEREAVQAEAILSQHLGAQGRSVILSAGGQGVRQYPAATPTNISAAIGHIATVMDPAEDLFVLFITSHGAADGTAALRERNRLSASLRPISLSAMLSQANIRNRVVIISACFSGAFIPTLQDQNTIVLTAAAADRTSFGCEPQRDWTYFGDAYFNRALRGGASMLEGFERAKSQISTWETEQHLTPSMPQSSIGANAAAMLQRAEREAH